MRLIDADALKNRFVNYKSDCEQEGYEIAATTFADCITEVEAAATIDAVPLVCGEWIDNGSNYKCSACGSCSGYADENFCPSCGAKMSKEES